MAVPKVEFGFGFNDATFSDRVLHIEVMVDSLDPEGDGTPNKESTRKDLDKENVAQVKSLHISSIILAGNSPFFYKLFKNGMSESHQRDATMRIDASEDAALMDILGFMYSNCNTLSATSIHDLLGVLMVADKFEVTSCISYCCVMLQKTPMSLELALLFLKLPSNVLVGEVVQPLICAAKMYLVARYSDFNKLNKKEAMDLPLCALEFVLGSIGLHVDSEDDIFDFVLNWVSRHYPKLEERREIINKHLARCICFSCMSFSKLKEVHVTPDFGHEEVSKLVIDALFFKAEVPCSQHIHASKDLEDTKCTSLGRIYKLRPIKVVPFEFPQPRCVVYFDLRKEEWENLSQSIKLIYSKSFCLGGRWFYLMGVCYREEQQNSFGLFVYMKEESESYTLDYEFAVIKKSSNEFQTKGKGNVNSSKLLEGQGYENLLAISRTDLMSKDNEYFIEGILHLRADLIINCS